MQTGLHPEIQHDIRQKGQTDEERGIFYGTLHKLIVPAGLEKVDSCLKFRKVFRPFFQNAEIWEGTGQRGDIPGSAEPFRTHLAGGRQNLSLKAGGRPGRRKKKLRHFAYRGDA